MTERVVVGHASEFDDGDRALVDTDVGEIGVIRVEDEFYALRNTCPHAGGPVCTGKVTGALIGDWDGPGSRVDLTYSDEPAISCPWHGWDFYLGSGRHVGDPDYRVPTYDVVVDDDGTVLLDL